MAGARFCTHCSSPSLTRPGTGDSEGNWGRGAPRTRAPSLDRFHRHLGLWHSSSLMFMFGVGLEVPGWRSGADSPYVRPLIPRAGASGFRGLPTVLTVFVLLVRFQPRSRQFGLSPPSRTRTRAANSAGACWSVHHVYSAWRTGDTIFVHRRMELLWGVAGAQWISHYAPSGTNHNPRFEIR